MTLAGGYCLYIKARRDSYKEKNEMENLTKEETELMGKIPSKKKKNNSKDVKQTYYKNNEKSRNKSK